jgi:hypothetical protein
MVNIALSLNNVGTGSLLFLNICRLLQTNCPSLTHLTFLAGSGPGCAENESAHALSIVPIDSNLEDAVDFSAQRVMNEYEKRQRRVYESHRMEIDRAKAIIQRFNTFVEESAPEWEGLVIKVAFISRRTMDSKEWKIRCEPGTTPVSKEELVTIIGKDGRRVDRCEGIRELFERETLVVDSEITVTRSQE